MAGKESVATGLAPVLARILALAALLALWEVAARQGWIDPTTFSSPTATWRTLQIQFASGSIYPHLRATLQEALWGLGLGLGAGAVLGWIAATSRWVGQLVEPAMLLLNAVPRVIIAPVFILWLGIGAASKVALSFFLVVVVVFFAVYSGLREVDRVLVERVVMLGGTWRDLLSQVYIPSVVAWVFSSLRLIVGYAFTGAVVGEFIASSRGLGYLLNYAQNTYNAALMMAVVLLVMAMVLSLFTVVTWVERRATTWKQGTA